MRSITGNLQDASRRAGEDPLVNEQSAELSLLDNLFCAEGTSVTAYLFGGTPLREALPDTFRELAHQYAGLMDGALERRAYKVEHNISEGLRCLASELGLVKAGARDVIEIHVAALRAKAKGAVPGRIRAYGEEGRVMVLELMGHLVSYYRRCSLGAGVQRLVKAEE